MQQLDSGVGGFLRQWLRPCLLAGFVLSLATPAANAITYTVSDSFLGKGQFALTPSVSTGWGERVTTWPWVDHAITDPFESPPSGHFANGETWTHAALSWRHDDGDNVDWCRLGIYMSSDSGWNMAENLSFHVDMLSGSILDCRIAVTTTSYTPDGHLISDVLDEFTPTGMPTVDNPYQSLAFLLAQVSQRSVPEGDSVWTTVLFGLTVGGLVAFRSRSKLRAGAN